MNNIAENLLCSGCGVCSAVCPKDCIAIRENERGELRPVIDDSLCVSCGKCKTVCPFSAPASSEKHEGTVFIGTAPDFFANGSSGGVASYFTARLLESKTVDFALLVAPQRSCDELFTYTICSKADDLKKCQGSAYYPVTLASILKKAASLDGSFAVIGVPCFITALKKLKKSDPFWDKKIKILIGIVCGHTPNKHLVDCLALKSGHTRKDIDSCRFRIKEDARPAWDYGVKLTFSDGEEFKSFGSSDFGFLFWRRLFIQKCCTYCRDVFANDADIAFMDAWLPEYKDLPGGTSLFILRDPQLESFFSDLIENGDIKETDKNDIYKAQESLVKYKNEAGYHYNDEKTEQKVQKIFADKNESKDILDRLHRLCYKESLKKKNPLLWMLLEIKDRF